MARVFIKRILEYIPATHNMKCRQLDTTLIDRILDYEDHISYKRSVIILKTGGRRYSQEKAVALRAVLNATLRSKQ